MKQYILNKIPDNVVTFLSTGYTNASSIIVCLVDDNIHVLKNVYTGQDGGKRSYQWLALKTGWGYDLVGSYESIKEACDKMVNNGNKILLFDDYKELFESLEDKL
jgi:hypothetical protein